MNIGDKISWQTGRRVRKGVIVGFRTAKTQNDRTNRVIVDPDKKKKGGGLAMVKLSWVLS